MFIPLPSANYFFLGFGVGVAFELAVFLGVGVAPLGALGACGVLWGLLGGEEDVVVSAGVAGVAGVLFSPRRGMFS